MVLLVLFGLAQGEKKGLGEPGEKHFSVTNLEGVLTAALGEDDLCSRC